MSAPKKPLSERQEFHQLADEIINARGGLRAMRKKRQKRKVSKAHRHGGNPIIVAGTIPPPEERQRVYVVGAVGHPTKIGIAKDVDTRLAALNTSSAVRLRAYFHVEVADARATEAAAHRALADYRLNGEWFDVTPEFAIETVKRLIA